MNKAKLKTYAPQARRDFIAAVTQRANLLGPSESAGKFEALLAERRCDVVLIAVREWPTRVVQQRDRLVRRIQRDGFGYTMEAVVYTWVLGAPEHRNRSGLRGSAPFCLCVRLREVPPRSEALRSAVRSRAGGHRLASSCGLGGRAADPAKPGPDVCNLLETDRMGHAIGSPLRRCAKLPDGFDGVPAELERDHIILGAVCRKDRNAPIRLRERLFQQARAGHVGGQRDDARQRSGVGESGQVGDCAALGETR